MPFDLPQRTSTKLSLHAVLTPEIMDKLAKGEPVDLQLPVELPQVGDYTCIDCGFTTADVGVMSDHQERQERYHSRWQRLKRRWGILLKRP